MATAPVPPQAPRGDAPGFEGEEGGGGGGGRREFAPRGERFGGGGERFGGGGERREFAPRGDRPPPRREFGADRERRSGADAARPEDWVRGCQR